MADFKIAFDRTEVAEGKNMWTITKGDAGGETWSGISRVANPNWAGWKLIDAIPNKKQRQVIKSPELERLKIELYRTDYWNPVWGDKIKLQRTANDAYDTAVNLGPGTSIKLSYRQFKMPESTKMSNELLEKMNKVYER